MKRILAVFILATALLITATATIKAQNYPHIEQNPPSYDVEHAPLNYFWDSRTQLCFASATFETAYGARVTVFTNVPCTEKVWAVINKK